ncbi:MAG TPA: InlB B-repeat-containing protein, partial [Spirochaetota bacterium]|nr:InlB B-repeat-containing protein [Spirochaetota bacterium]
MGWNTKANGSGTTYTAGQPLVMSQDTILYAKWGKSVSVNFDPNSPTSGSAPSGTVTGNTTLSVPGNPGSLTKTGYTFGGWNTKKDGTGTTYAEGSTLLLMNNMTLFAKWNSAAVAGNGVRITAANAIGGTTISSTCKLYWYITTDKYLANPAAVVESGSFSSVSETKNVDLPAGTYYVWGFIDKDNSGTKSAGDYGAVTMITVEGFEASSMFSMKMYREALLLACAVTSSSGYIPAKINFAAATTAQYVIPASEAVMTVGFQYTGSKTVSENNCIREYIKLTQNDFDTMTGDFHGYLLTGDTSTDTVTIRCAVGTPLYFAASMDAAGTHSGSTSGYPLYTSGDPFIKYLNRGFA